MLHKLKLALRDVVNKRKRWLCSLGYHEPMSAAAGMSPCRCCGAPLVKEGSVWKAVSKEPQDFTISTVSDINYSLVLKEPVVIQVVKLPSGLFVAHHAGLMLDVAASLYEDLYEMTIMLIEDNWFSYATVDDRYLSKTALQLKERVLASMDCHCHVAFPVKH